MLHHLGSVDAFRKAVAAGPVVADFYADWCGPCRMVSPVIEKLADDYDGKLEVLKINTDEFQSLAGEFGVMSIPTVIFFKSGKQVSQIIGAHPYSDYEDEAKKLLT